MKPQAQLLKNIIRFNACMNFIDWYQNCETVCTILLRMEKSVRG